MATDSGRFRSKDAGYGGIVSVAETSSMSRSTVQKAAGEIDVGIVAE